MAHATPSNPKEEDVLKIPLCKACGRRLWMQGQSKVAVGHFNVSDSNQFNSIVAAASELGVPVIIGATEGEQKFFGTHEVAALVHAAREKKGLPVFLNSDHTRTIEGMKAAVDAGFDAVLFDGAKETIEEYRARERGSSLRKASGREVLVEGELGYIGSSSQVHADIPEGAGLDMTTPELAVRFIQATGIDLLAPSVGNIHGLLKGRAKPALDPPRIEAISSAIGHLDGSPRCVRRDRCRCPWCDRTRRRHRACEYRDPRRVQRGIAKVSRKIPTKSRRTSTFSPPARRSKKLSPKS